MPIEIVATELRNHTKQYFDFVESGESVMIVRNGKLENNTLRGMDAIHIGSALTLNAGIGM